MDSRACGGNASIPKSGELVGYAIRTNFGNVVAGDAFLYEYSLRASGVGRFDCPRCQARCTSVGRARGRLSYCTSLSRPDAYLCSRLAISV